MAKKKKPDYDPIKPETVSRRRRLKPAERAAYYEACQAAVALLLDQTVEKVSIDPDGKCEGQISVTWTFDDADRDGEISSGQFAIELDTRIMCIMAGMLAENIARGKDNPRIKLVNMLSGGLENAQEVLRLATVRCEAPNQCDRMKRAYLNWLEISTQRVLKRNWQLVEAIATALLENHEVCAEELDQIKKEVVNKTQSAENLAYFDDDYGDWLLPGEKPPRSRSTGSAWC